MEAQRQLVQPPEGVLGELARGILPDAFEGDVAQIVEHHGGEAPGGIGDDKGQRDHRGFVRGCGHGIDRTLVGEGQCQHRALGQQHEHHRTGDPTPERGIVGGPQIGKEAPDRHPAFGIVGPGG